MGRFWEKGGEEGEIQEAEEATVGFAPRRLEEEDVG